MADEKAKQKSTPGIDKEAAKATLLALAGTKPPEAPKAKPEEVKAKSPSVKTDVVKAAEKPDVAKAAAKPEVAKESAAPEGKPGAAKAETKKEPDPNKEFVDGIMAEMSLKGASKKRLIKMLGEQLNFDKHKVMFRLKRALISERYAAAHAEAGH